MVTLLKFGVVSDEAERVLAVELVATVAGLLKVDGSPCSELNESCLKVETDGIRVLVGVFGIAAEHSFTQPVHSTRMQKHT